MILLNIMDEEFNEESTTWIDMLKETCTQAMINVRAENFSHGLPIVYMDKNGWLVEEYSNGEVKPRKKLVDVPNQWQLRTQKKGENFD